jgi:predicted O-linked N-acetylglucosamine transferase (SPINDLY family)
MTCSNYDLRLIGIHDRSQFEIIAFSFGPRTHDEWQQRLVRAFDKFVDVRQHQLQDLARNLDAAYAAIHGRYQAGLPPDHIRV